jgi:hypothetical protein
VEHRVAAVVFVPVVRFALAAGGVALATAPVSWASQEPPSTRAGAVRHDPFAGVLRFLGPEPSGTDHHPHRSNEAMRNVAPSRHVRASAAAAASTRPRATARSHDVLVSAMLDHFRTAGAEAYQRERIAYGYLRYRPPVYEYPRFGHARRYDEPRYAAPPYGYPAAPYPYYVYGPYRAYPFAYFAYPYAYSYPYVMAGY